MQEKYESFIKNNNNKICKKFRGAHHLNKTQAFYHDIYQLIILRISAIYRLCLCVCGLYIWLFLGQYPFPLKEHRWPSLQTTRTWITSPRSARLLAVATSLELQCRGKMWVSMSTMVQWWRVGPEFSRFQWFDSEFSRTYLGTARSKHCKRLNNCICSKKCITILTIIKFINL